MNKTFTGLALITLGVSLATAALLVYLTDKDISYLKSYGPTSGGIVLLGVLVTKSGLLEEEISDTKEILNVLENMDMKEKADDENK